MEWAAVLSVAVVKLALPADSGAVPRTVVPSLNVTVPPVGVGWPEVVEATVAVKLTGWPCTEGLAEEAMTVVPAKPLTAQFGVNEALIRVESKRCCSVN